MTHFAKVMIGNPEGLLMPPPEEKQASIAELVVATREGKTFKVDQSEWERGPLAGKPRTTRSNRLPRQAMAGIVAVAGAVAVAEESASAVSVVAPAPASVPFHYDHIYTEPNGSTWYALGNRKDVRDAAQAGFEVVGGRRIPGANMFAVYAPRTVALVSPPVISAPAVVAAVAPTTTVPVVPATIAAPSTTVPPTSTTVAPPPTTIVAPPTTVVVPAIVLPPKHKVHKVSVESEAKRAAAKAAATAKRVAAVKAAAARSRANAAARAARAHAAAVAKLEAKHEAAVQHAAEVAKEHAAKVAQKAEVAKLVSQARADAQAAKAKAAAAAKRHTVLVEAKKAASVPARIYDYLVANGLSPIAATGILGNMQSESPGLDPERIELEQVTANMPRSIPYQQLPQWLENDPTVGWGLAQSTPASKVINWAKANGKDPNAALTQVEWICAELAGTELLAQLNAAPTAGAAAELFEAQFERPQTLGDRGTRARQAQQFYNAVVTTTTTPSRRRGHRVSGRRH